MGLETLLGDIRIPLTLYKCINWGRKDSFFPFPVVMACCGLAFTAAWGSHDDVARFGAEFPRFSPRHTDLPIVGGSINHKMTPILKRVDDQSRMHPLHTGRSGRLMQTLSHQTHDVEGMPLV